MDTLQPNQLFAGRYRLIEQKGSGSFGDVWLARDTKLFDMEIAIKIYISLDDSGVQEFMEEFVTAYDLNHSNLLHASYFDVFERRPYLVMPYCPASAVSLIGNVEENTVWKFIRDVSGGLAYLHSKDVIHRDIKPDNILIDSEGNFQITDFGISTKMRSTLRRNSKREIDSSKETGGSLPYMGPEMFTSSPDAVKATDIWALGATLFEIVTGELPFFGQGGVMLGHGADLPDVNTEVSQNLKDTIVACLQKETWNRPTAEQLHDYAVAVLDGKDVKAPWKIVRPGGSGSDSGGDNGEVPKKKRRIKAFVICGICLLAVLCAVVISFLVHNPNKPPHDPTPYDPGSRDTPIVDTVVVPAHPVDTSKITITPTQVLTPVEKDEEPSKEQAAASKAYMEITDVKFGKSGKSDSPSAYYYSLEASGLQYLNARIYYNSLASSTKSVTLYVKIYKPDGTLFSGTNSPSGYTYSVSKTVHTGTGNYMDMLGWGNENGTAYKPGTYKFEFWYNGNRLYTKSITLTGTTAATYLTVDSKTAVSKSFTSSGGSETFSVSTDAASWTLWGVPSFCQVTNQTATSFTLKCNANTGSSSRSDYMKVKADSKEVRIDITQSAGASSAATYLTVDSKTALSKAFSSNGGSETFYVSTDASNWTVWGVPSFCQVTNQTATSFTLKCNANTGTASRSDYMKVKADSKEVRIDITQSASTPSSAKSIRVEKAWLEHNVLVNGVRCIKIHVKFSAQGFQGQNLRVACYFLYSDGKPLKDTDGRYTTSGGNVSVNSVATPSYDKASFSDFSFTIPNDQLHVNSKADLKCSVLIYDEATSKIWSNESDYMYFTYNN